MKSIKIYTETAYSRKIILDIPPLGGSNPGIFFDEMVRRCIFKVVPYELVKGSFSVPKYVGSFRSIILEADSHIGEIENKDYEIKDLSLLNLLESVISELTDYGIEVDLLKIEILLLLLNNKGIFPNHQEVIEFYNKMSTIFHGCNFFLNLKRYLYNLGKFLVYKKQHDYYINKDFEGELTLKLREDFDSKYDYFTRISAKILNL